MTANMKRGKPTIAITIYPDTLEKADRIVKEKLIPGIVNRSALIEYALDKVFKEVWKEAPF